MSWRDAPLYVEAHDLARWVVERTESWPNHGGLHLAPQVVGTACDLLGAVALALTFPTPRAEHLEAADRAIVRLRVLLRLARDLSLVSPGGLRFAGGRLDAVGRMVGGWRKRVARGGAGGEKQERLDEFQGTDPERREARDAWR